MAEEKIVLEGQEKIEIKTGSEFGEIIEENEEIEARENEVGKNVEEEAENEGGISEQKEARVEGEDTTGGGDISAGVEEEHRSATHMSLQEELRMSNQFTDDEELKAEEDKAEEKECLSSCPPVSLLHMSH